MFKEEKVTDEFDGDLLIVEEICPFEDNAERALTNLLTDTVVHAHNVGRGRSHDNILEANLEDRIGRVLGRSKVRKQERTGQCRNIY